MWKRTERVNLPGTDIVEPEELVEPFCIILGKAANVYKLTKAATTVYRKLETAKKGKTGFA